MPAGGPIQWAFVGFDVGALFPFVLLPLLQRLSSPDGSDEGCEGFEAYPDS